MDTTELVFVAQLMGRPELIPAVALDPRVFSDVTARVIYRTLYTQGPTYAAPALMMSALAEAPEEISPEAAEFAMLAVPEPDDVELDALLETKARIERRAEQHRLAERLEHYVGRLRSGEIPLEEAVFSLRSDAEKVVLDSNGRDHTTAGILKRLRDHTPAIRWKCGAEDLDWAYQGIGPDKQPAYGMLGQGEIVLVAARYGVGKSRLALNWIAKLLDQNASVALVVLEDNEATYSLKLMGAKFGIKKWQLERYLLGGVAWLGPDGQQLMNRCDEAIAWFEAVGSRLRVYDGSTLLNVFKFREAIELLRRDAVLFGTTHAVIDYIQSWVGETAQIEQYAFDLRAFAGRHNVGLVEISQFANDTIRWGSAPGAVAAKGSGAWAQAAHVGIELEDDPAIGQRELRIVVKKGRDSGKLATYAKFDEETGQVLAYYGAPELMQLPDSEPKKGGRRK